MLCRDLLLRAQWSLVFHPRGTLLVLEVITLVQLTLALWVYVHSVRPGLRFIPSPVVMVSQMSCLRMAPRFWQLLSSSRRLKSTVMWSFLGDSLPEAFPYSALFGSTVDTWLRQLTRCVVRWCSKLWLSPQLHFIEGCRLPFRAAETDPRGLACSEDH